jgi:hypothetical protein
VAAFNLHARIIDPSLLMALATMAQVTKRIARAAASAFVRPRFAAS